jgi:hypothetical protein
LERVGGHINMIRLIIAGRERSRHSINAAVMEPTFSFSYNNLPKNYLTNFADTTDHYSFEAEEELPKLVISLYKRLCPKLAFT